MTEPAIPQAWPHVALVEAPAPDAAVIYDFNHTPANRRGGRWITREKGFDLGVPELAGDIDAVYPVYGDRTLVFTLRILGTKAQALAQQAEMARALLNPGPLGRGWLLVQLNPLTQPVWFAVYRPRPGALSFEHAAATTHEDIWDIPLSLPAEPFAYGARITQTVKVVAQDPSPGVANPCWFTLDDIEGDAPTPVRFLVESTEAYTGRSTLLLDHHAGTLPTSLVRVPIGGPDDPEADSFTVGGFGVTNKSGSGYTGGTYAEVSFANPRPYISLYFFRLRPARYRLVVRAQVSDATTVVDVRAGQYPVVGQDPAYAPPVRVSAAQGSGGTWLDLGIFQLPLRAPQSPADLPPGVNTSIELGFDRIAGTGTLNVDHAVLMPVDRADTRGSSSVAVSDTNLWVETARRLVVDGTSDDAWALNTAPNAPTGGLTSNAPAMRGVIPAAVPGLQNAVMALFSIDPQAPAGSITRNLRITASYHPMHLYLGDA